MDKAFGKNRRQKTAYLLRPENGFVRSLSYVALDGRSRLQGSLRFWPVRLAERPKLRCLLLGPLAVEAIHRGKGVARALITRGLEDATRKSWQLCFVISEESLYKRFGFTPAEILGFCLPAYERPGKLHVKELEPGCLDADFLGSAVLPVEQF